jgi:hypothetical protein
MLFARIGGSSSAMLFARLEDPPVPSRETATAWRFALIGALL